MDFPYINQEFERKTKLFCGYSTCYADCVDRSKHTIKINETTTKKINCISNFEIGNLV